MRQGSMDYRDLAEMLDALPELVIRYRLSDLIIVYCNSSWAKWYGLEPAQVVGRSLHEFLSEDGEKGLARQLALLGPDNPNVADESPRADLNHPDHWFEWVDQYLPANEVIAVGRDVTRRHRAELAVAKSEARFRDLADNSADVVWSIAFAPTPHLDYMSPSVEHLVGYPPSYFLEDFSHLLDVLDDEGRAIIARVFEGVQPPDRFDHRCNRSDGSIADLETHLTKIPGGWQGVSRDVTELRGLQNDMVHLALHDPLTGLANRRLLDELLDIGLARTQRSELTLAVAFLDLDGFKEVNDDFGHDAGDTVLRETTRRLLSVARSADVVARVGGDEFVIVYEPGAAGSDALVSRVDHALSLPIEIDPRITVRCQASIGYADTRTCGFDAAALLAAADAAMYEVKHARLRGQLR